MEHSVANIDIEMYIYYCRVWTLL